LSLDNLKIVCTRIFECVLIGDQIAVSQFTIVGEVKMPLLRGPSLPRQPPGEFAFRCIWTTIEPVEGNWLQIRMRDCAVYGFEFAPIRPCAETTVKHTPKDAPQSSETEHFRIPAVREQCHLLLADPGKMRECKILIVAAKGELARELNIKILAVQPRTTLADDRACSSDVVEKC
jgi:hypothetical protein